MASSPLFGTTVNPFSNNKKSFEIPSSRLFGTSVNPKRLSPSLSSVKPMPQITTHYYNVDRMETKRLLTGVSKLSELVFMTYGPHGQNIFYENAPKLFLEDGLSIATELKLEDEVEQMGVDVLRQAAEKTKREVGDGTTLTIVLAYALCRYASYAFFIRSKPLDIALGMKKTSNAIVTDLLESKELHCGDGLVVGGGCALARLYKKVNVIGKTLIGREQIGATVFEGALLAPLGLIAHNAGLDEYDVWDKVLSNDDPRFGYNAITGQFEDIVAAGVVDSVQVVRRCIENATSVVVEILLAERFTVKHKPSPIWTSSYKTYGAFTGKLKEFKYFLSMLKDRRILSLPKD